MSILVLLKAKQLHPKNSLARQGGVSMASYEPELDVTENSDFSYEENE